MNQFQLAFGDLYAVQTDVLGIAILATVTGYGTSKPALLSGVDQADAYIDGSTAGAGNSFLLQILETDLSGKPAQGTQVTCNGSASGLTLQVIESKLVNGTWEISIGDINNAR